MTTTAIKKTKTIGTVDINMSIEDAQIIARILRFVGGDPEGPRGAPERLYDALLDAGVDWDEDIEVSGSLNVD